MTGQTFDTPDGGFKDLPGIKEAHEMQQQAALKRIEDHIAFEGVLELKKWQDTSGHGFKVTLGLQNRAMLDFFDGVMTMRKSRGGQRYHAIIQPYWTDNHGERKPDASQQQEQEWQFCGRGWAESQGAHIAIHLADRESIAWWRMKKTADQVEAEHKGNIYFVMLLELDDDETIINQRKRGMMVPPPPPKGGPRSKFVARTMQDSDFCLWLNGHSIYAQKGVDRTTSQIDALVKQVCKFSSKIELDNGNEKAWTDWEQHFHKPFLHYMRKFG